MKYEFAKLFNVGDHQVLITKEYDAVSDEYKVVQTTHLDDMVPTMALSFTHEDNMEECFTNYGEADAQSFIETISDLFPYDDTDNP